MAFCSASIESNNVGFTVVDNIFITQFMSGAPKNCIEVYLFGLSLCSAQDTTNSLEVMQRALDLSKDDILDAYAYWEELGLVHVVSGKEIEVIYLPIRTDRALLRKVKSSKYAQFNRDIQTVISGRMITTNEYNEYYMFLETTLFDPDALVFVAKYCVEIKNNKSISYKYILTVARSMASGGVKSLEAVEEKFQEHYNFNDDLTLVFKNLHIKRKAEYSDKEKYERWVRNFGFSLDTIIGVSKTVKDGGMEKLDNLLEEYYSMKLMSDKEIADYVEQKQNLLSIAKSINKTIGVYYQSLDTVVQEYTVPWTLKGFSAETLSVIAGYCFKNSIRTLQGMNLIVEKFFKLGLTTVESINQYLEQIVYQDKQIREILDKAGVVRNITANDRANFRLWTDKWNMPMNVILAVAETSVAANNPMQYMNKVLSDYFSKGINSLDKIESVKKTAAARTTKTESKSSQREYTQSELQALFSNLDEIEV